MARPRKNPQPSFGGFAPSNLSAWAEALGEALGRGVARGINTGLSNLRGGLGGAVSPGEAPRRRGRPPKNLAGGPVPADRKCSVSGCPNPARSKGLCSKHYQAARREAVKKA